MNGMEITFTDFELEAIGKVLDDAAYEYGQYLDYGDPEGDYGEEWGEVGALKARHCLSFANSIARLIHGETERWTRLAFRYAETTNACDCDERSWHGDTHDSACPLSGIPRKDPDNA